MSKRRPRMTLEGPKGRVVIRCWGKGYRIKATAFDGDIATEMLLAARAMSLLQEACRSVADDPEFKLIPGPIRHIDDHGVIQ